jgi:hypothetical protein
MIDRVPVRRFLSIERHILPRLPVGYARHWAIGPVNNWRRMRCTLSRRRLD